MTLPVATTGGNTGQIFQNWINQNWINQNGINQNGINQNWINQNWINQNWINQNWINQNWINVRHADPLAPLPIELALFALRFQDGWISRHVLEPVSQSNRSC